MNDNRIAEGDACWRAIDPHLVGDAGSVGHDGTPAVGVYDRPVRWQAIVSIVAGAAAVPFTLFVYLLS